MTAAPVTVYTNASEPLDKRLDALAELNDEHQRLHGNSILLRVSLDHYDADIHDVYYGRGEGAFNKTLGTAERAHQLGIALAVTTQTDIHNNALPRQHEEFIREIFRGRDMDLGDVKILPDIPSGAEQKRLPPQDTSPITPAEFQASGTNMNNLMCHISRTVLKLDGSVRVYPCTILIPDSPEHVSDFARYDMGATIAESLKREQALDHPACRAYCVKGNMSCANPG